MKHLTKLKLAAIHQICDAEDKSIEYMYQLMKDMCKVDVDTINNYFEKEDTIKLFKELNELTELMIKLGQ